MSDGTSCPWVLHKTLNILIYKYGKFTFITLLSSKAFYTKHYNKRNRKPRLNLLHCNAQVFCV